jgi:hypothetical protein
MTLLIRSHFTSHGYLALLILLIAVVIFAIKPYNELVLTYDSRDYIDASESIHAYFHGANQDGATYLIRPPLFPLYLSLFVNKQFGAWLLNVVSFITSLYVIVLITAHIGLGWRWIVASVLLVTFSLPWLQNHFILWTEPAFCALLLTLMYCLLRNNSILIIIALCLALFFLRKVGVLFIFTTCLYYLLKKDYRKFVILSVVSLLVVIAWEVLCISLANESPSAKAISMLMALDRSSFADVVTGWFLPRKLSSGTRLFLFLATSVSLFVIFRNYLETFFRQDHIQLFLLYSVGYCLFFALLFGTLEYHDTERYLSVVLPIVCLFVVCFLSEVPRSPKVQKIAFVVFCLWAVYPVARTLTYLLRDN